MTEQVARTRNNAGANETRDIEEIIRAINTRSPQGLRIIHAFRDQFGREIRGAEKREGNRGIHFDFYIILDTGERKRVEHKGSQHYTPILPHQTPWEAGVQFHNGGCEKYTIAKMYARVWYDTYIRSGVLKTEWSLEAPIPTFDEWFSKDAKAQDDPKTPFGKELKRKVREARGVKGSLKEKRELVNTHFNPTAADLELFKTEALAILNHVLEQKDYWLTIHGDVFGDFHCKWYPNFTIPSIQSVTMRKELDIWFSFVCEGTNFQCILRWGKGAGFSNIRIDARD